MTTSAESNYSFTTKIAGDLLTVRGDSSTEFAANIDAFLLSDALIQKVIAFQADVRTNVVASDGNAQLAAAETALANGGVTATYTPVPAAPAPATVTLGVDPSMVPAAAAPQQAATGEVIETVMDKWGKKFTYGLPQAPVVPNGRMLLVEATNKAGKPYKAWVDPLTGPKPCKKVTEKAEPQWIND